MKTRLVKAVLAYDGRPYVGWQIQKNGRSIQSEVERALSKILNARIKTHAASRTDSGVHAEGQVIHFKTGARLADRNLKRALNHCLPESVAVRSLKSVTGSFHARYQSKSKHYRYKIYNGRQKRVFLSPAAIWFNRSLDVAKMKKAAKVFVGEHDFSSFAQDDLREHKVRHIKSLRISRVKDDIQIDIKGDGFLRHMVRIITGALIDVGVGKIQVESIQKVLKAKKRQMAGPTAPAKGLSLIKVSYQ